MHLNCTLVKCYVNSLLRKLFPNEEKQVEVPSLCVAGWGQEVALESPRIHYVAATTVD